MNNSIKTAGLTALIAGSQLAGADNLAPVTDLTTTCSTYPDTELESPVVLSNGTKANMISGLTYCPDGTLTYTLSNGKDDFGVFSMNRYNGSPIANPEVYSHDLTNKDKTNLTIAATNAAKNFFETYLQ